jgi:uncharacterized protein
MEALMRLFIFSLAIGLGLCLTVIPLCASEPEADHQLVMGCSFGNMDRVKKALDAGANVNASGARDTTAIMWASERGLSDIVRLLLDRGADMNAQNESGLTALMLAARSNRIEVVKLLLSANADKTLKDKIGNTAAKWAAMLGHQDVVKVLDPPS